VIDEPSDNYVKFFTYSEIMTLDSDAKFKEFIFEAVPSATAQLLNCKLAYIMNGKHIEASAVECTKFN
jgi:hypothetical protein